jgi:hypothetical protein
VKRFGIFAVIAAVTFGGIALAGPGTVNQITEYFQGGLFVHPRTIAEASANKVTKMLGGSGTIDFASQTITCNTSNITVTGAATGDPCFVGPPSTGGAANSSFTCYVSAADTVTVKHCPAGTASDPASASYAVRVISSQ